jgi:hypothetical protein
VRHLATHLAGLGVLVAAFLSAGILIEHYVGSLRRVRTAAGLTRLTLGMTSWIVLLFAFAAAGVLRLSVVGSAAALVMVIGMVVAWHDRLADPAAVRAWIRTVRPDIAMLPLLPVGVVLLALLFESLMPYVGWDASVYHLTLPKLYLANGGFRRVPFNVSSYWPLNIQLLYAFAMLIHDYIVAKLLHLMFLVLCVVAAYRLASKHSSQAGGSVAAMLLLANPVLLDEARFAYIDLGFAFFFLMAFAFALEHLHTRRAVPLVLAGISCGVVAGTKILGAVAAPCIAGLVVFSRATPFQIAELRHAVRDVLLYVALPAFFLALPWYLRSYWYTGNPLYPLFYPWFGGPEWNTSLTQQFLRWQQSIGMGRQFVDYLLLPFRVVLDGGDDYGHFDGRISPVWSIVVPVSLAFAGSNPVVRRSLAVACLYFVAWAATSQQARFLIPIIPLVAIAGGISVDRLLARLSTRPARVVLIAGVGGALLLWSSHVVMTDGARAGRAMLIRGVSVPGDVKAPVYQFISDTLPADARLMLLNTNQGFFVDREYIADSFFEASQMNALILEGGADPPDVSRRLRERGITHVLLSTDDWDIPYPRALWDFLGDRRLVELLYTCPDRTCFLFRVRGDS